MINYIFKMKNYILKYTFFSELFIAKRVDNKAMRGDRMLTGRVDAWRDAWLRRQKACIFMNNVPGTGSSKSYIIPENYQFNVFPNVQSPIAIRLYTYLGVDCSEIKHFLGCQYVAIKIFVTLLNTSNYSSSP